MFVNNNGLVIFGSPKFCWYHHFTQGILLNPNGKAAYDPFKFKTFTLLKVPSKKWYTDSLQRKATIRKWITKFTDIPKSNKLFSMILK